MSPCVSQTASKDYTPALLTHVGQWVQLPRRQDKGSNPQPRWMPLPELLYAQVVKTVRRRRLVGVMHRVAFGTKAAVAQVLAACGWQINTAFVERLNLTIRQHVAAVGRRVSTLCKGERRRGKVYIIGGGGVGGRAPPSSGGPARQRWRRD